VLRLNTLAIGWSGYRVLDPSGRELPVQVGTGELVFQAELPPLGFATFTLRAADSSPAPRAASAPRRPADASLRITTDHYDVRLQGGVIVSLVKRASGREYVDPARPYWNDLVLQNDNGDLWLLYQSPLNGRVRTTTPLADPYPTPASDDDTVFHAGIASHTVATSAEIVEDGPVRTVVRSRGTLRYWIISVEFVQQVTLYRSLRRIDFRTELTGHGKHYRVRVAFPTAISGGRIMHSVPFGQVERPEGEYPTQGWLGYADDAAGVYLLNRGLPGGNVSDGVLLLSLLRSAAMEYKGPSVQAYEEGVRHTFSYSVVPADAEYPTDPWWEADSLNSPPMAITAADVRPGEEPRVRVEPASVVLSALYLDDGQLTARLHETAGVACAASLWVAGLRACRATDALSVEGAALPVQDEAVHVSLGPFQIKTLRLDVQRSGH
jgi:alpha-mannosidase